MSRQDTFVSDGSRTALLVTVSVRTILLVPEGSDWTPRHGRGPDCTHRRCMCPTSSLGYGEFRTAHLVVAGLKSTFVPLMDRT